MPDAATITATRPLMKSDAVMLRLGYKNRSSFWQMVQAHGVPHIRFNRRRIMFDPDALDAWLARRSSTSRAA